MHMFCFTKASKRINFGFGLLFCSVGIIEPTWPDPKFKIRKLKSKFIFLLFYFFFFLEKEDKSINKWPY